MGDAECLNDEAIAAFVERSGTAEELAAAEAHIDECAACRTLLAGYARAFGEDDGHEPVPTPSIGSLTSGARLARYVILELLGAGGMGMVYAAYDPELDRRVAVKILRTDRAHSDVSRDRLLREARAMARLSHPNVVTVHDVGTLDGDVFLAMEYIDGGTLASWLAAPRPPEEVVGKLIAAGCGLAAAHAEGLVHRDFKPDNVLLGKDGRVCVADFGLVHARFAPTDDPDSATMPAGDELTMTGAVLGTPAYMAPEQHAGRPIDARTDQFAFCVTLYEALFRERPFEGSDEATLREAVVAGRVKHPAAGRGVSRSVRDVVLRGLAADPDSRFATMEDLLNALTRDRRRWRRFARVAAVLLFAIAATFALSHRAPAPCSDVERRLGGIWDAERRARGENAFAATKLPFGGAAWERVSAALDGWSTAWTTARRDACEASVVHRDESDELYSLRTACLDRQLDAARALTDLFVSADATVVERSIDAVRALPDAGQCHDAARLLEGPRPPADPAQRRAADALRGELARIKALADAGKPREALPLATAAVDRARALGERPVLAEALLRLAHAENELANGRGGATAALEAIWNAEASRDDRVAAEGWILLALVYFWVPDIDKAEAAVPRADAAIERIGGAPALRDELDVRRGMVLFARGKVAEAEAVLARRMAEQEQRLGSEAPALVETIDQLTWMQGYLGRYTEAARLLERAVAIVERDRGPEHPAVGAVLRRLGASQIALGAIEPAQETLARSLAIYDRTYGPDHTKSVFSMIDLADAEDRLDKTAAAAGRLERALAIEERTHGPTHPAVAVVLDRMAEIALRRHRPTDARVSAKRATDIWEAAIGLDHFESAGALVLLGRAELEVGDARAALAPLERAVRALGQAAPPARRGEARLALAQALAKTGGDRSRIADLAQTAADSFEAGGAPADARRAREWLEQTAR